MKSEYILLIVLCVLAGLVALLAIVYAYIYCVKMRPAKRPRGDADTIGHHYISTSARDEIGNDGQERTSRHNPFLLLHYVKKRQDNSYV